MTQTTIPKSIASLTNQLNPKTKTKTKTNNLRGKPGPNPKKISEAMAKARDERRLKVGEMLLNRVSAPAIASALGVHLETVVADKKVLEQTWKELQTSDIGLIKGRELEALDQLERECIIRMTMVDVLGLDEEQLQAIGIAKLRTLINDEGLWFDRRLRVMQERLKLLGAYPKPEPIPVNVSQDNRSVTVLIQAPDHSLSGEQVVNPGERTPMALGEFMRGILTQGQEAEKAETANNR